VVGLAFYASTLLLLRGRLPFLLCVLSGVAMTVATFFQHGILWYNSIAMMLLALILWLGAIIGRQLGLKKSHLTTLCALLFLSSMTKANFHLLALAMAVVTLSYCFLRSDSRQRKDFVWAMPLIFLSSLVLGPVVEVAVNGTTFHDFVEQVFRTPHGRLQEILPQLRKASFYFNTAHDFYPDDYSGGIYLAGAVIYAFCAGMTARKLPGATESSRPNMPFRWQSSVIILLAGLFISSLLLTASNTEIQVLTASYLIVGLIAIYVMFADLMAPTQNRCFRVAIGLLCAFFLIVGGATSFKHSRLRFLESRTYISHGKASVSPGLSGYFEGVRFTKTAWAKVTCINKFVEKFHLAGAPGKIYWGPGLEIFNRVYDVSPTGRLPLWYHKKVSVNESDGPRIVEALNQNNFEWFIASSDFIWEMPNAAELYMHQEFALEEDDSAACGIIILRRKQGGAAVPIPPATGTF
jgi:hypothetical protein